MIRVYLDWNVFSYLNNFKDSKEPYISLDRILNTNKGNILIPYTSAHLSDLITSYKKSEKGKAKTLENLDYLAELTDHRCILYNPKEATTYPDNYDIKEYFYELLDNDNLLSNGMEGLFGGTAVAGLFSSVLDILKLLPSGIDTNNANQAIGKSPILNEAFKQFTQPSSFYDLLDASLSLTNKYNTEPTFYRNIRNASLDELQISNDYTQTTNPIDEIGKVIQSTPIKKDFEEFADANLKNYFGDKKPSRFDVFTNYYFTLDYFGYYRDKVFKNMLQDAFHAYYGAHCDFFVTDDDNTYHKAKAIYEYLNIDTVVCKTQHFISEFYAKAILNNTSERNITEIIYEIIATSFVLKSSLDESLNPVDVYKVTHYVLSYFNRLQVTHNADKSLSIYLYKNSKNYSSFYFFKEIETITNKLVAQFGLDINARAEYIKEIETQELIDNKWNGRFWQLGKTKVTLNMQESPFGITLSFDLQ
jgi:hypothetical protein